MRVFADSNIADISHDSEGRPPNTEMNALNAKFEKCQHRLSEAVRQIYALDSSDPVLLPSEQGIWRQGSVENSVWVDLTKSPADVNDLIREAAVKFEECIGVKLVDDRRFIRSSDSNPLVFEIILKSREAVARACQQKATICGEEFEVSPAISQALQRVDLCNIPNQTMDTVLQDLTENLSPYGKPIYAIVEVTNEGVFFNGNCTVYFDTTTEDVEYKTWTHKFEWKGSRLPAYAVWYPVPLLCDRCHKPLTNEHDDRMSQCYSNIADISHDSEGRPPNTEMNALNAKFEKCQLRLSETVRRVYALDSSDPVLLPSEQGIWRQGSVENSVWVDLTKSPADANDLIREAAVTFEECMGVKLLEDDDFVFSKNDKSLVFEIILKSREAVVRACQQKATICGEEFEVSPAFSQALQRVDVGNIPYQTMGTALQDLTENLSPYVSQFVP